MGCTSSKVVLINPSAMPQKCPEQYSGEHTGYGFNPKYVHYYNIPSNDLNYVHKDEKKIEGRRHYEQIYLAERGFLEDNEKHGISEAKLLCYDSLKPDIHGQAQKPHGANQAAHKKINQHTARYSKSNPRLKRVHGFDPLSFSHELVRPAWRKLDLENHDAKEQGSVTVILDDQRHSGGLTNGWRRQDLASNEEKEQGFVTVMVGERHSRISNVDSSIRFSHSSSYGLDLVASPKGSDDLIRPVWRRQDLSNHDEKEQGFVTVNLDNQQPSENPSFSSARPSINHEDKAQGFVTVYLDDRRDSENPSFSSAHPSINHEDKAQGCVTVYLDDRRHSFSSRFSNVESDASIRNEVGSEHGLGTTEETMQVEVYPVHNELEKFEYRCPPRGEDKVVFYITSLKAVRKTYEDCDSMKLILQSLGIQVDERDVTRSKFKQELASLMGNNKVHVPKLFIRGQYIGGIETVKQLHEDGTLLRLVEGIPYLDSERKICEGCGDMQFVPCLTCNGSCKVLNKLNTFIKCGECDENGLILCPLCS